LADNDDDKSDSSEGEPTLVERWLRDQQDWQRTATAYLDALVKNDEFLVHLGNAMRGSLLAGKPYPTAQPASAARPETTEDDRLDRILFALNRLEGEMQDLRMTLDEIRDAQIRRASDDDEHRKSKGKHKSKEGSKGKDGKSRDKKADE